MGQAMFYWSIPKSPTESTTTTRPTSDTRSTFASRPKPPSDQASPPSPSKTSSTGTRGWKTSSKTSGRDLHQDIKDRGGFKRKEKRKTRTRGETSREEQRCFPFSTCGSLPAILWGVWARLQLQTAQPLPSEPFPS